MQVTRATFTVHRFDADAFGLLSPAALSGYLQDAAGRSAESLDFGLSRLHAVGLTWVLARQRVVLDQAIRLGDTLDVDTWPSGIDRLAALRDFRVIRDGAVVGRALTTWYVMDLATRRPSRPHRLLPPERHAQTEHVLPVEAAPLPALAVRPGNAPALERRFQVRYADIDVNRHVTASTYVGWAVEAIEESEWRERRLASLDVQFLAEAFLGQDVLSRSAPDGDGARLHAVARVEDGKELARARTTWVARG